MDTLIARDFASGVSAEDVAGVGMIQGEVRRQQVMLARRGDEFFAAGAKCPHTGVRSARASKKGATPGQHESRNSQDATRLRSSLPRHRC